MANRSANSRSLLEFELFGDPMTRIKIHEFGQFFHGILSDFAWA